MISKAAIAAPSAEHGLLQAMRARIVDAPAVHEAELHWLNAVAAGVAPHWVGHWAATRIDVWHGVAAVAALLGDLELHRLLTAQGVALAALLEPGATTIAIDDVAAAVARVAAQLAAYHRRAYATRDLCWAALTSTVQQDPAKRQEAEAVAAASVAAGAMTATGSGATILPFEDGACATLLATVAVIVSSTVVERATVPVPAYDAAAAAACTITVAQGYALWRAASLPQSHTATALDALLHYSEEPGFPQTADIIAQGLDVALLRAAQVDAVAEQLADPSHGEASRRAVALTAELPMCKSPTLVEIWVATRGLVDSVETVWWDALGMVALAPLAAATAHDAEPSARTAAELTAAAQLAHTCFGHRDTWALVLSAPPLLSALHRCFLQMNGQAPLATGCGDVIFAGTSAACKASVLRRMGELLPHPAAPLGWGDVSTWIAAMRDDVLAVMPAQGVARSLRAWGQPIAVGDIVQMFVPTPPVRSLVLP